MAATDLERLVVSLDADIRKFEKELKRANNVADGQFRQIERRGTQSAKNLSGAFSKLSLGSIGKNAFSGFIAGAVSALAPVALLTAAISRTKQALADFGKIADDIKPTGLKPELYQALSFAALEAGSSQDELNAALVIFAKNVGLAQSGTGPLIAGLQKLNPELLKNILAAKDQDERVRLVAEAMKQLNSQTRQNALASVAFGKGGVKIVESLKGGSAAIDEFIRRGKELGILLTEGDLAEADDIADKVDFLAKVIDTNLNKAFINLAPAILAGSSALAKFTKALSDTTNSDTPITERLGNLDKFVSLLSGQSLIIVKAKEKINDFFSSFEGTATDIQSTTAELSALFDQYRAGLAVISPESLKPFDELKAKIEAGTISAEDAKKAIADIAAKDPKLAGLIAAFNPLIDKLNEVIKKAGDAAAGIATLFEGNRAGGFAFQAQREAETGAARDFFARGQADAGRSSAQRELDAKSEEVLNRAKAEGIELTEEAVKVEAERELAIENAQKEREKADKDTGKDGDKALKDANKEREHQQELIRDTIAGLHEESAAIGFETEHLNDSNAVRERARVVFETLNRLQAEGITITDDLRASVEREAAARGQQVAAYDAAEAATEQLKQAQEDLAERQAEVNDAFRDSFKGFIHDLAEGKSLTDALSDALGRLGDRLLDMALDDLFGQSGSSGFGQIGALFGLGGSGASSSKVSGFNTSSSLSGVLGAGASLLGGGGSDTLLGGSSQQVAGAVSKGVSSGLKAAGDVPGTIWNFFTSKGLASHQVAGILGNVSAESAFNPTAVGDSGNAFGLFQHNDRSASLFSSIGGRGNLGDVNKQLEFAWKELQTTESKALDALKASTDVRGATAAFAGFERPKGFSWDNPEGAHNFTGRLSGAEEALAKFGGTTGEATSSVSNLGEGSASALGNLSKSVGEATGSLGQFGSSLSSFLSSSMGGGSNWFQNLSGLFGGAGGALGFMNSISPAATSSIIGAGGGFTGLFANGTDSAPAGWAVVGEKGPELVRLRGGETILDHERSMRLPRLSRYSPQGQNGRMVNINAPITVMTPDAPSFLRSQNQIANKTASTVDRAYRIT